MLLAERKRNAGMKSGTKKRAAGMEDEVGVDIGLRLA